MGWTPGTETWPKMIDTPVELWPSVCKEYNPNQMQIEFFWPLEEQIPLDLDYTRSKEYIAEKATRSVYSYPSALVGGTGQVISMGTTGPSWVTATFNGPVETPELVLALDKKPNFVVQWLYKLLRIKWKMK